VNGIRPVVRYLVVCRDIRYDRNKVVTLVGLISAIRALRNFPVRHRELCVFVQLTECRGSGHISN
jgi:hypothetical protein